MNHSSEDHFRSPATMKSRRAAPSNRAVTAGSGNETATSTFRFDQLPPAAIPASLKASALLLFLAGIALPQSPFRFEEASPESLRLNEGGRPVYTYNHGPMLPEGVPEDRARCCYVHPVWARNGVVVTDDFPKDHYHHRGIFWSWPIVKTGGGQYDLWTIRGIHQRFVRWLDRKTYADSALLAVENGWFVEERQVARETVRILAHKTRENKRQIDFDLTFDAVSAPLQLRGDPTDSKGYGGFCVRFAPREETVIVTDEGRETEDTNMVPHSWAEQSARFENGHAALRIEIDPSNPGFPNGWCLRYYGFLGVNYPGNELLTLEPGKPMRLRYSVIVEAR